MPIPPTSQGNSNVVAILVSTENVDNDDEEEEEENSNDLLDHESMELLPMPSKQRCCHNDINWKY